MAPLRQREPTFPDRGSTIPAPYQHHADTIPDLPDMQRAAEETDVNIKNIIAALISAAPDFAKAKAHGEIPASIDIPSHLVSGSELFQNAKNSGETLDAHLAQMNMFQMLTPEAIAIARIFNRNIRSSKRIAEHLRDMAKTLLRAMESQNQVAMPGTKKLSSLEIINATIKRLGELYGREGTEGKQRHILGAHGTRPGGGEPTGSGRTSFSLARKGIRSLEGEQNAKRGRKGRLQDLFSSTPEQIRSIEDAILSRLNETWRGTFRKPEGEPRGEHQRAHQITSAFGFDSVFFETDHPDSSRLGGFFDAQNPSIIYLNVHGPVSADWTALHESIHALAVSDPGLYSKMRDDLWNYVQNFDEYATDLEDGYLELGIAPPSENKIREEFVADICSDLLVGDGPQKLFPDRFLTDASVVSDVLLKHLSDIAKSKGEASEGTTRFSQQQSKASGTPSTTIQSHLTPIINNLSVQPEGGVRTVQSQEELPQRIQDQAKGRIGTRRRSANGWG